MKLAWMLLALSLAAGILLGAIFFGGLWWTVRHGALSGDRALVRRQHAAAEEPLS